MWRYQLSLHQHDLTCRLSWTIQVVKRWNRFRVTSRESPSHSRQDKLAIPTIAAETEVAPGYRGSLMLLRMSVARGRLVPSRADWRLVLCAANVRRQCYTACLVGKHRYWPPPDSHFSKHPCLNNVLKAPRPVEEPRGLSDDF